MADEPKIKGLLAVLRGAVDRHVKQRARDTVLQNAKDDPTQPLAQRVVENGACDFCSKFANSKPVRPQQVANRFHQYCKCQIALVFSAIRETYAQLDKELNDAQVRKYLRSDKQPKTIVLRKYLEHVEGTDEYMRRAESLSAKNQYGPSRLLLSEEECYDLIVEYAGSGQLMYNSNWKESKDKHIRETIIDSDVIVGVVVNNRTGVEVETTVFRIHYSSEGAHIVPDYPSKKRGKTRRGH